MKTAADVNKTLREREIRVLQDRMVASESRVASLEQTTRDHEDELDAARQELEQLRQAILRLEQGK